MSNDADLRLGPMVRLRNATAQLLADAERALRAGDPGQDRASIRALRRQLEAFDRQLNRSRQSLSRPS